MDKGTIGIKAIKGTIAFLLVSVILLSGCVENEKAKLPEKNITNLTPENLKTEIINTIDSIKFYRYNISVEEKTTINGEDYYYSWIVAGYGNRENKIFSYDYTLKDEYGTIFDDKNFNINDTVYFSHNVMPHKICRGGFFSSCETTHKTSIPFTTQLSYKWGRDDEMSVPFKIFDSLSAMKEILNNSDIKILSKDEKNYKIMVKPNRDGMKDLIRHIEITYTTGGATFSDDFENACNNIIRGMKNLTLIMYVDKKTLAINKIHTEWIFKGVYGKSTLTANENLNGFNKKINIEIPKEVEDDAKKR